MRIWRRQLLRHDAGQRLHLTILIHQILLLDLVTLKRGLITLLLHLWVSGSRTSGIIRYIIVQLLLELTLLLLIARFLLLHHLLEPQVGSR